MRPRRRTAVWPIAAVAAMAACLQPTASQVRDTSSPSRPPPAASAAPGPAPRGLAARDIDQALHEAWKLAGVEPAPRADDARFLRRAWLDLAGVVPPPQVVTRFLDDPSPDKRHDAVAALVSGPRWATRWADRWERLLLGP